MHLHHPHQNLQNHGSVRPCTTPKQFLRRVPRSAEGSNVVETAGTDTKQATENKWTQNGASHAQQATRRPSPQ
eukprot:scaffold117621_cov13-Tisochrysis_lutea.AAC.1